MGGEDAKTYGTLALLLAQYLKQDQSQQSPLGAPDMLSPPVSRGGGGSVLENSGLQGGVSPAMVELLRQMQQRQGSEPPF